jgi:starch-binding outer membrane protein, SusD/RagB family
MEAGQTLTDAAFYKQVVFEKKHYLYPIPSNEIYKDVQLVQNLGW